MPAALPCEGRQVRLRRLRAGDDLAAFQAYRSDASWPRDNAARIFSGTPD